FLWGWDNRDTREFRSSCNVRQFLGRLRIAELFGVNIYDSELHSVFHFDFANLMQMRLPQAVLREVVGHALRHQNVSGIAAIHHSLRDVNSGTGNVRPVVDIFNLIDWAAVDTHPQPKTRMAF